MATRPQDTSLSNETNYKSKHFQPGLPTSNGKRLARGLGWFSLGLGLTELLAPRFIARISGVPEKSSNVIRLYGLREIASGVGIFIQKNPSEALWTRVAGDVLDLTSLGLACTSPEAKRGRITFATANVLAVTALDVIAAKQLSGGKTGVHASASCIVNRDPDEVYRFWRDFGNLPRFMQHLESVEELPDGRSRWVAKGPAGMTVAWEAAIVADDPGRVITWRSLENSDVDNAGAVRFERAAGGRGTIVKVNIQYDPPAGVVGATVAKLFGEEPNQQLDDDMRRFKQVMELGEVVVSEGTLFGTGYFAQRPAQPPAPEELQRADSLPEHVPSSHRSLEGRRGMQR
ncbi:MAG TPA: SRPBCC family protein [Pyrinomonadaceae bacterium]|nr:SRPBCC family protein [Pyrinomonadaceae bacterium]